MAKKKEQIGATTTGRSGAKTSAPAKTSADPAAGLNPMAEFRHHMDRLFDDFFGGWPSVSAPIGQRMARPLHATGAEVRFDVSESEGNYEITAELPGIEEKDIEVTVENRLLTIKGEKKSEREEKNKDFYLTERSFGSFRRSFPVPDEVDEEKIVAKFDKGVLRVTLPKIAGGKKSARRISVSAG